MNNLVIVTNEDKCVGCNKCIVKCPVNANNASFVDGKSKITIDPERCIQCGECINICDHGAREYTDDTAEFMERLKRKDNISVLVAPAILHNISDYKKLFGFLKQAGVNLIYDVSFGADITTWAYLKAISEKKISTLIAQPCPVIVSYIERYQSGLIPYLAPVHSPTLCAAIYLKKYRNVNDDLAFLSPCIGKKIEFTDEDTNGYVKYNVTVSKLKKYLKDNAVNLSAFPAADFDSRPCDLGFTFSRPGGLRENVEYYTGNKAWVKQTEGIGEVCSYLKTYENRVKRGQKTPLIVDVLNCSHGCNLGTATEKDLELDDIDYKTNQQKDSFLAKKPDSMASEMLRDFDRTLRLEDFIRQYTERRENIRQVNESDIEKVFEQLGKNTPESRNINCFSCGYGGCLQFATAVAGGNNDVRNCTNYSRIKLAHGKNEFDTLFRSLEEQISVINSSLEKIQGSISGLDDIALQIKIISINASIEAVHAGANGKAFSVVASAIKELADKSEKIISADEADQVRIMNDIHAFEGIIKNIKQQIDMALQ